ncbi:MAG: 16S rRNA (adenine(1518)-N(6)/adenine(1519)-N(6))-dimethyltransferase RsmA [Actinobacteria bacterium]|nr:16S rRNA (adenine(1518)-N(6)/adenine(1519)-N(6))-dimethyltransferase RsmA [Cyanobacteriota bacterium]MCL5771944.1 16S rRNA (adenine(1518)-N(6)/adenine(1519)-N(6))-dimethyltransferase RsmA [Actinomycetota bacterium]
MSSKTSINKNYIGTATNYISTPTQTMQILKQYDLHLKKTYGQNFLIDTNVLKKIVNFADLKNDEIILEVGSGIGSLTEILMPNVKKIICVELDRNIAGAFKEIFKTKLSRKIILITKDAMKLDYDEICKKYSISKFVSNLPYKIAAPLILKILSQTKKINDFFITIQKDIADRILAKPGDKNYNAFTVKLNYYAQFIKSFPISRVCFYPKPFVDSATIHLRRKENLLPQEIIDKIKDNYNLLANISYNGSDEFESFMSNFTNDFFKFVEDCFSHRRKKLINSLMFSSDYYKNNQEELLADLKKLVFNKDIRPEELSLEDYLNLFISLKFKAITA